MWTDNETTADLIGFRVHADLVRSVITDPSLLPVTLGVFGDWGGGKTSIMRMLEQDLNPERQDSAERARYERIACLYFNGWLFEGYDDAKSALLSSVLIALGEHKRFGPKIRDGAASLLKSVNWMRIARFGLKEVALPAVLAYATGGASLVPTGGAMLGRLTGGLFGGGGTESDETAGNPGETKKAPESALNWDDLIRKDDAPAGPMDVRTFRERFASLLKDSDIDTLVVLIDDLDRCSPQRIIDNLEAIKLFLNVEGTAFVIGADPRIVRHAISTRYHTAEVLAQSEGTEPEERLITDYLEKLIQVPYWLPRLSPAETETYMALLFCQRDLDVPGHERCLAACAAQREENRYGVFGYAGVKTALGETELPPDLAASLVFCSAAAPLITEGLKGNPRQVKRFLNAFALRKRLAKIAGLENIRDDVLVKLMILEYTQIRAFRQLFDWQVRDAGFPSEIRTMEESADAAPDGAGTSSKGPWDSEFLRRWIASQPQLAEVDLRDYFWVARDKLGATLSGMALIPPVVRRVVDDLLSGNSGRLRPGVTAARDLDGDQRATLFEVLAQNLVRHPEQKVGYDAFRALIEAGIPDALDTLGDIAPRLPAPKIPAAVGIDLRALTSARPETAQRLTPVLEQLSETATAVGRALKTKGRARR